MTEERQAVREKILVATIQCIDREGLQSCTIRRIAERAVVNSAAINYYFGSKDKLVNEALARTMEEFSKMPDEAMDPAVPASRELLESLFQTMMEGMFQWPGITRAHLYGPLVENNNDTMFVRTLAGFMRVVVDKLKELKPGESEDHLKSKLIQMISAILIPGLMAGMFPAVAGIDFNDPAVRAGYVSDLVNLYFG